MVFQKIREKNAAPKLVLVGNFGAGNVGDELILAGFLEKIGKELPKSKVVVLATEPKLVRRFHGVDALPPIPTGLKSFLKMNWWRSFRAVKNCDAVIFPGGGLFSDEENWRANWIWGLPILVARYFWRPVFLLGQSIGPFEKKWTRKFVKFCLAKVEWIGVRDPASEKELKKLGTTSKKIKLCRDSAFWLANRLLKVREIKTRGILKILISVRDFPKTESKFWDEFARALDTLVKQKHVRIFFTEFGKNDRKVWEKVCQKSKNSAGWKILELSESAEEILRAVRKFDLVIGMRLHSLVAARIVGVPAIGLNYSRKVGEFAEKSVPIENFRAEKLVKILN